MSKKKAKTVSYVKVSVDVNPYENQLGAKTAGLIINIYL